MKIHIDKKYIQMGITAFFTAIAILMVVFFIWNNDSIKNGLEVIKSAIAPVMYGLIIAYLLSPILNFFEKKIYIPVFHKLKWFEAEKDKNRDKHIRTFSLVSTLIFTAFLLYLFFSSVIPQLVVSIRNIGVMYPRYTANLIKWLDNIMENNPDVAALISTIVSNFSDETDNWLNESLLPAVTNLLPNVKQILTNFSSSIMKFIGFIWNIVIGFIISIYVLTSKEKFAMSCVRLCYAVFERKTANKFIAGVRFTHQTFIGFLSGKVVDSVIIGIICFICMKIMHMPYGILISVIIGVTNIIPFFGPWFGAIPSSIILLMINPKMALYFIIFVVVLQQLDGNLIGPMILSQTTGVTTFWIITSITIFSGLFGIVGMILAVPVTGVLFAFATTITDGMLKKKNLPTDPDKYKSISTIDENGEIKPYEHIKPPKNQNDTKIQIIIKKLFFKIKKIIRRKKSDNN